MRNDKKEIANLFLVYILAALVPASVLWYRSLPYRAESADDLKYQIFSRERRDIESELGQRNSKFIAESASAERWAVVKQSLLEQGATQAEAERISMHSEGSCSSDNNGKPVPHWPILIRRGYVRDKSVWVSVCAKKSENPQEAEIVTGWDYVVRVIDPANPTAINGPYASHSWFPRCYGPNSPFPISP